MNGTAEAPLLASRTASHVLVSSYYGPGVIGGWYLTAAACFISCGLHHKKRRLDTVNSDVIAIFAFPIVAAAHLIKQVQGKPQDTEYKAAERLACVEASLNVTETSLGIHVVLFLMSSGFRCAKRGYLFAMVGLFCFAAECTLFFSLPAMRTVANDFSRPYIIHFEKILIGISVVLVVCLVITAGLTTRFAIRPKSLSEDRPREDSQPMQGATKQEFLQSHEAHMIRTMISVFLPCSLAISLLPLMTGAFEHPPSEALSWVKTVISRICVEFMPTSNASTKDLDQAAALLSGASVFVFSLWDAAKDYVQRRLQYRRKCLQEEESKTVGPDGNLP